MAQGFQLNTSIVVAGFTALVLLFYASSLLLNEWKVGVALHEGHLRVVHVGLHNAVLQPTELKRTTEVESLRALCDTGRAQAEEDDDYRLRTLRSRSLRVVELPMEETPYTVWCDLEGAGKTTNKIMLAAWLPALAVLALSAIRSLQSVLPEVGPIINAVERMGLTQQVIDTAVL